MKFRQVGNPQVFEPTLVTELRIPSNQSEVKLVVSIEDATDPLFINRSLVWINSSNELVINRGAAKDLGLNVRDYK